MWITLLDGYTSVEKRREILIRICQESNLESLDP